MNDLAERILYALVVGFITGVVVALIVWLLSVLLPGIALDPGFWGTVAGVIAGLYAFITRKRVV
jgi:hypothetical protein